jgi:hypothetical protein
MYSIATETISVGKKMGDFLFFFVCKAGLSVLSPPLPQQIVSLHPQ